MGERGKYYFGVDFIKGILIILVIVGHVIRGTLQESLGRYIIYSFHMPLFIGISGFLINKERFREEKIIKIIHRYIIRIVIPWILAVIVYEFIIHGEIDWRILVGGMYKPYYHLWFVLGYLLYTTITLIFIRLKWERFLLIGAVIISVLFYDWRILSGGMENVEWIKYTIKYIKPSFFFFFVLGVQYKSLAKKIEIPMFIKIFSIAGLGAMIYKNFYIRNEGVQFLLFFVFNTFLLITVLEVIIKGWIPRVKGIEWFGKNSYSFYLWHVLGKIAAERAAGVDNLGLFYVTNFMLSIIYTFIFFGFDKVKNKILTCKQNKVLQGEKYRL